MAEFFFTAGSETNPHLTNTGTSPAINNRFDALVPSAASNGIGWSQTSQPQPSSYYPLQRPSPPSRSPSTPASGVASRHGFYDNTRGYGSIVAGTCGADEEDAETDDTDEECEDGEDDGGGEDNTRPTETDALLDHHATDGRLGLGVLGYARGQRAPRRRRGCLAQTSWNIRRLPQRVRRHLGRLWLTPTSPAVRRAVGRWWSLWALLVVLPAVLAVAWSALPFPQAPLEPGDVEADDRALIAARSYRPPGHGEARVRINFWFFLFAYYGPYNLTALLWITKVFNLYSLNWWPPALGFPRSVALLAAFSLAVPAVLVSGSKAIANALPDATSGAAAVVAYAARGLLALGGHNTTWVSWTFSVMAMPVAAALVLLLVHDRHLRLRHTVSDTQRIFTTGSWSGDEPGARPRSILAAFRWRRHGSGSGRGRWFWSRSSTARPSYSHDDGGEDPLLLPSAQPTPLPSPPPTAGPSRLGRPVIGVVPHGPSPLAHEQRCEGEVEANEEDGTAPQRAALRVDGSRGTRGMLRPPWLPASFVRFLWLMAALFTSLLVYVLGEASASLFLAALPAMRHATVYAVAYVYGWTVVVFLLDLLTGWILGGHQGERVGSYPLGWVFKLYFMLTYQTYVRALYVRLRSPSQFVYLQVLSSTTLVVLRPLLMSQYVHRLLAALRLNGQTYGAFQKVGVRNLFVRVVADNASMLAFLGSLLVLHASPNRSVYPYFAFDRNDDGYTFSFTLYASSITWACELVAAVVVSALVRHFYGLHVLAEARLDLAVWPDLLPASVAVAVHVLQNMLFSIIRLRFW